MTTMEIDKQIKKQITILLAVVVTMFGFCYALVPIYSVFCKVTGLNGKTKGEAQAIVSEIDQSRTVTVELLSTLNESIPSEFVPSHKKLSIHPGEYVHTSYWVKNNTQHPMVVQAIPSVTPGLAAKYVNKIECFCFKKQPLDPQEGKEMSLVFTVTPDLPTHIRTISLAYTLFDVTQ